MSVAQSIGPHRTNDRTPNFVICFIIFQAGVNPNPDQRIWESCERGAGLWRLGPE